MTIFSFLVFLDHFIIDNARLFTLETDTGLVEKQNNTDLLFFFVPQILFEVFAQLDLRKMIPRIWLPSITHSQMCRELGRGLTGSVNILRWGSVAMLIDGLTILKESSLVDGF